MWKRLDVVFTLKSPLHIGYLPFKGSVISPTRYYVLGKNFWGAITKRATERLSDDLNYRNIGKQVKDIFRFSYFYVYDGETIFIPKYSDKGIVFGDKKELDKLEFERKFIGSRVLTAIDSNSGTAKDVSLHEIEFIKDKFRDEKGNIRNTRIIGCMWIRENSKLDGFEIKIDDKGILVEDFNLIEELTLGGEQGYGFGLVKLVKILNEKRFPIIKDKLEGEEIRIQVEKKYPILSHLKYDKNISFQGDLEIIVERGYFDIEKDDAKETEYRKNPGKLFPPKGYYFSPGTLLEIENKEFLLSWNGIIRLGDKNERIYA